MSELAQTLSTYVPTLVARHFARDPAPLTDPLAVDLEGAVFFADISGFTHIAEGLAERGLSGAEELTRLLNTYFGQMISIIASHGGDIVKFAGDALLAVWYNEADNLTEATLRAAQCAVTLRDTLNNTTVQDDIQLSLRVGIGAGAVKGIAVGGVLKRWEFLIAGPPLQQVGPVIDAASAGQVLLSAAAYQAVGRHLKGLPTPAGHFVVEEIVQSVAPRPLPHFDLGQETVDGLKGFISGALLDRLDQIQSGWLAEHRRLTVMFLQVTNLGFDSPDAVQQLQDIMQAMQVGLYNHEGSVRQLIEDDKGTVFIAAFGLPPFTHQDDPLRGVQAALAMQTRLKSMGYHTRIGITSGHVFCGPVGNAVRREYTLVGSVVNMAARLMGATKAYDTDMLCDAATYKAARRRLAFRALPPITLKNIREPVTAYTPFGEAHLESSLRPLVGRHRERDQLTAYLRALQQGQSQVVYIEGVAGIGKSRLIAELVEQAEALDILHYVGQAAAVDKPGPYQVWNEVLRQVFETGAEDVQTTVRRKTVLTQILKDKDLMQHLPLLNPVLKLDLPENEATADLSGSLRLRSTRSVMLGILKAVVSAGPVVIVLDNAQWMDSTSWAFTLAVSQEVAPLLLVIAGRPQHGDTVDEIDQLMHHAPVETITLEPLSRQETHSLVRHYLGVAAVDEAVIDLIYRQAQGNPFFSEELALALRESESIVQREGAYVLADTPDAPRQVALPETLQGVITSRIDRLHARLQLTLKVASVIGTTFTYRTLYDIYPIEPYKEQLEAHLATLQDFDFIEPVRATGEDEYRFKQSLTHEVAYNLIPFMQRRQLHEAVALWYERNFVYDLSPHYARLAHHWQQAEESQAALKYLERAGEQALRNGTFQEAVDFFTQASALAGTGNLTQGSIHRLARWERLLAEAHWGLGQLNQARHHAQRALRWLQDELPATRRALWRALLSDGWRQIRHRLLPQRYIGQADDLPFAGEAASTYRLLSELIYLEDEMLLAFYTGLRALNLAESVGEKHPILARTYANAYVGFSAIQRPGLARLYKRLALRTVEKANKDHITAPVLVRIAMYDMIKGQWTSTRSFIDQALAIYDEQGDRRGGNDARYLLGFLHYFKGTFWQGADAFDELAIAAQIIHHTDHRVIGLSGYALHLLALGKTRLALIQLEQAKQLWEHAGVLPATRFISQSLFGLVCIRQEQPHRARPVLGTVLAALEDTFRRTGFASLFGTLVMLEALLALPPDDAATSDDQSAFGRALAVLRRFRRTFPAARPFIALYEGYGAARRGKPGQARQHWQVALQAAQQSAQPYVEGLAHLALYQQAQPGTEAAEVHRQAAWQHFEALNAAYDLDRLKQHR